MEAHIELFNERVKKHHKQRRPDPLMTKFLDLHGNYLEEKLDESKSGDFEGEFKKKNTVNSMHDSIEGKNIYVVGRSNEAQETTEERVWRRITLGNMKRCRDLASCHHGQVVTLKDKDSGKVHRGTINLHDINASGLNGVNFLQGEISVWKIRVDAKNVDLIVDERTAYAIRELHKLGYPLVVPLESARLLKESKKRSIDSVDGKHDGHTILNE